MEKEHYQLCHTRKLIIYLWTNTMIKLGTYGDKLIVFCYAIICLINKKLYQKECNTILVIKNVKFL